MTSDRGRRGNDRRRTAAAAVTTVLTGAVALAACGGGEPARVAAPTSPSTTTAPTRTATPTPTPALVPLRGGPVLAVKIDNTPSARPRVGLDVADVVYVEPVEGGLTRLLAVFSSRLPKEVGPVRSARESDIDLVANYGRVAFAYSGGSAYTVRALARGRQVNLSYDASGEGFRRERSRPAPYNVIGDPAALLARAGGSVTPKDIGFRFGPPAKGGTAAASVTARWPASRVSLAWNAKRRQYLVTTDGKADVGPDGRQHGASTVVVQYVGSHLSGNRDVNGMPTPLVDLTGKGKVVVLRDGKAWSGTWKRASATAPTSLTAGGKPITLAPGGPVWVLLVTPGQGVTVG
ncbi:DUF3048 domain-containing protein [Knoellia sp. 3-2P3]|uniref:DUF3048 domain-containing protein n=1 Tax=unclassified Knoellia TaxID=2618719 RepID=UPI0023DB2E5F|nr:DUF3048 domain-containing protein [Knoellia sp. 3-2P3]MDF2093859.1 DUF3048 domain-containing protein [Knoellia sp. 3-2P3]